MPNGSSYIPMTFVKNGNQVRRFRLPVGSSIAIAVPPGINPQSEVDQFNRQTYNLNFLGYWAMCVPGLPLNVERLQSYLEQPFFCAFSYFTYRANQPLSGYELAKDS